MKTKLIIYAVIQAALLISLFFTSLKWWIVLAPTMIIVGLFFVVAIIIGIITMAEIGKNQIQEFENKEGEK